MGVDTEAAADTAVSAEVPILVEAVVPTAEVAAMAESITHPESRPEVTATTAQMGRGTPHRGAQLQARFMVPAQDRKVQPLPGRLLHRQVVPVATTSREINRELALPENPTCSPGIIREQIAMFASNAPE